MQNLHLCLDGNLPLIKVTDWAHNLVWYFSVEIFRFYLSGTLPVIRLVNIPIIISVNNINRKIDLVFSNTSSLLKADIFGI